MKDVAKIADVDISTVSLAINKNPRIPEETRNRIEKIIREINYVPNIAARTLAAGRSNKIAVISNSFADWFGATVLRGIEKSINWLKYSMDLYPTRAYKERENEMLGSIIYGGGADAIIGIAILPDATTRRELKKRKIPFVSIEEPHPGFTCISSDNRKGAYMAAKRLIDMGRKNIGIIAGLMVKGYPLTQNSLKLQGAKDAFNDAGIEFTENNVVYTENYSYSAGAPCFRELVEKMKKIDGLFCAVGDNVAIGVIKEAKNMGISIPGDMGLVGYDDIELAPGISPELTTIRQPVEKIGEAAIAAVIRALNGGRQEKEILFDTELVIRESA